MTNKQKYTRDVSKNMMKSLTSGAFKPFVNYVKKHPKELALCFRGSDPKTEKVIIYKHNFTIWELFFNNQKPCVKVNLDLARFMKCWETNVAKRLLDKGFRGPHGEDVNILLEGGLVERKPKNSKNNDYEYHAIDLLYELIIGEDTISKKEEVEIEEEIVEFSYKIISKALDIYLNTEKPINYIKKYYYGEDDSISFDSRRQKRLEKRVQQEIFLENHSFPKDGLFIYDLEFHQPEKKKGNPVPKDNEPDMLGIRFEENQMISICFIEVKSTESALNGKHGVVNHLQGMEYYIRERKDLMIDRKMEACRILNQYHKLKLYGVKRGDYKEEDFIGLKEEIIFIFTNDVSLKSIIESEVEIKEKLRKNPSVEEVLEGFEEYKKVKKGKIAEPLVAVKKQY